MTSSFDEYLTADARLVILRSLAAQPAGRLNEVLITKSLDAFGHNRTRDWVRTQLRAMADLGAVEITEARTDAGGGTVMIAGITRSGIDHVERRSIIEGVARPSPEH